ncbi:hypothetical protein J1N35_013240 [Gossypium stocksii]|uniref:Uncharacterized protein n=1 Tax=Gossypium stocksii TaxID=47602 RepID=A0A9D4A860_9ROSI|nr:hypothetical protein J1N35_013240 [Gossypium stocksii]
MIDRMIKELLQVKIKLIRRIANKAADWVASKYKEEVSLTNWVTRTPTPLDCPPVNSIPKNKGLVATHLCLIARFAPCHGEKK